MEQRGDCVRRGGCRVREGPSASETPVTRRTQIDQGFPFMCQEFSICCFIEFSEPTYAIHIVPLSALQMRKLRFKGLSSLPQITQPAAEARGADRPAIRLALKPQALPLRSSGLQLPLSWNVPKCSRQKLLSHQVLTFQSFLLGLLARATYEEVSVLTADPGGEDKAVQLPPSLAALRSVPTPSPPPCHWPLRPHPGTQLPLSVLGAGGWERTRPDGLSGGRSGWLVVFKPIFIHIQKKKICSVFCSASGQGEVSSLHLCGKMRILQETK